MAGSLEVCVVEVLKGKTDGQIRLGFRQFFFKRKQAVPYLFLHGQKLGINKAADNKIF